MPRYSYRCTSCDIVLEKTHSYRDTLTDCEKCETSGSLKKIMSPIKINKKNQTKNKKTGEVVEENIEDNRHALSGLKKNLKKRVYKK